MKALSREDARRFLAAAEGDRFHALWLLLLRTGLQPSEALGLRGRDVGEERVTVQRSLVWVAGHEWEMKEPKTPRARRAVTLPATTRRMLGSHRVAQSVERLRVGASWVDHDLAFCNSRGEPVEWRIVAKRHFARIRRIAGLEGLRPSGLRHSGATLLLAAGENVKVVSEPR